MRFLLVTLVAACGASPAPMAQSSTSPSSTSTSTPRVSSTIDPITGLAREPSPQPFAPGPSEHVCTSTEEVVFACTLEGPPPQAITSLCLVKGTSRKDPVVIGRERTNGKVDEPFAGQPSHLMLTVLEADKIPFSVEAEQRAERGAFGAERQTEPKAPSTRARYRRNIATPAEVTHTNCDPSRPITDNLDAMRAYKL